jgi:hypothetical protein
MPVRAGESVKPSATVNMNLNNNPKRPQSPEHSRISAPQTITYCRQECQLIPKIAGLSKRIE